MNVYKYFVDIHKIDCQSARKKNSVSQHLLNRVVTYQVNKVMIYLSFINFYSYLDISKFQFFASVG